MKINKKMSNALKFVELLNNNGGLVRTADAAEILNIDLNFLQQIALKLKKNKVITVVRGPSGGSLVKNKKVTAYDIAESLNEIPMIENHDDLNTRKLKEKIHSLYRQFVVVYER